jgi:TRAP-type C4-dicarboxylate transport system permease small subunit
MFIKTIQLFRHVKYAEVVLLVTAFVALVGLAFTQVILRNAFDTSIIWADVAIRILVLWVTFLGAMVATQRNRHIKIDLIDQFLSPNQSRYLQTFGRLISAAIMFAASFYCLQMVILEYEFGTVAFANIPTWLCQSILPLGFFSMGVRFATQSYMYWRGVMS